MIKNLREEINKALGGAEQKLLIGRKKKEAFLAHADRVLELSTEFGKRLDLDDFTMTRIEATALLHGIDDLNFLSLSSSAILNQLDCSETVRERVLLSVRAIGFEKRLKGVHPGVIESMVVADADLCDAMGISGILRLIEEDKAVGRPFFDPNMAPRDYLNYDLYTKYPSATTVNCIFEKLFRSKKMMCTSPGLTEATIRKLHMEDFMRSYFRENNLIWWETWMDKYFKYLEI